VELQAFAQHPAGTLEGGAVGVVDEQHVRR
jgi:hypothetical protein